VDPAYGLLHGSEYYTHLPFLARPWKKYAELLTETKYKSKYGSPKKNPPKKKRKSFPQMFILPSGTIPVPVPQEEEVRPHRLPPPLIARDTFYYKLVKIINFVNSD
jgi:hypothetical protein